ncbi:hypothetical protein DFS34DRAFT_341737 [Phlyctochytrium arcticum]|nr:hypothetical protein DFS34DRAFT_341737 [Phlyctochytrium arcticum]
MQNDVTTNRPRFDRPLLSGSEILTEAIRTLTLPTDQSNIETLTAAQILELWQNKLRENRAKQAELKDEFYELHQEKEGILNEKKRKRPSVLPNVDTLLKGRYPFFHDPHDNSSPEPNQDTKKEYQKFGEALNLHRLYFSHKWKSNELALLREAVRYQNRLLHCNPETGQVTLDPRSELENMSNLNWEQIATHVSSRDAQECFRQWTVSEHPFISRNSEFTPDEIERLRVALDSHEERDWERIAVAVGNGRVGIQCFRTYRQLTKEDKTGPFTPSEDATLHRIVSDMKKTHDITNQNTESAFWSRVASHLPGRSRTQCLQRWKKIGGSKTRGKWTPEEDHLLKMAVETTGKSDWGRIAALVGTRDDIQCRERYTRFLNPALNTGPWTLEDFEKLREAMLLNPSRRDWTTLSSILSRPDYMIRQKHKLLHGKGFFGTVVADKTWEYVRKLVKRKVPIKS